MAISERKSAVVTNVYPAVAHRWELNGGHVELTWASDAVKVHGRKGVPILAVSSFWMPPKARGRGAAHGLMHALTRYADRSRTDLWLYVKPYGPTPRMSLRALAEFYENWGFRRVAPRSPDYEMVRRYLEL